MRAGRDADAKEEAAEHARQVRLRWFRFSCLDPSRLTQKNSTQQVGSSM